MQLQEQCIHKSPLSTLGSLSDPLSAISLLVEQKQIVHNDHRDLSSCTTSSHTVYMSFHIYLIFNEAVVNTHSA